MVSSAAHLKILTWIYHFDSSGAAKVLLLKRTSSRGGDWQPVTGNVDEGESQVQCAAREAHEETGFVFRNLPESLDCDVEYVGKWGLTREKAFALNAIEKFSPKIDPKEHETFQWCKIDEANKFLQQKWYLQTLVSLKNFLSRPR